MKLVLVVCSWTAAVMLTLVLWERLRRRGPQLLAGRVTPAVIRRVAALMLLFGLNSEAGAQEPGPKSDPRSAPVPASRPAEPPALSRAEVSNWVSERRSGLPARFKHQLAALESGERLEHPSRREVTRVEKRLPVLGKIVAAHAGKPAPAIAGPVDVAAALAALDEMEAAGWYDAWLSSYLWRRTAPVSWTSVFEPPVEVEEARFPELYGRIHRHARIVDALTRLVATAPATPRRFAGWGTKGGPRPEPENLVPVITAIHQGFPATFATAQPGLWDREATVELHVSPDSQSVQLWRGGQATTLEPGAGFRFGRLDVVEVPDPEKGAAFTHLWLGTKTYHGDRFITVWDLGMLPPTSKGHEGRFERDALDVMIDAAGGGDELALDRLERILPFAFARLARATKHPPGGAAVAQLAVLFWDRIVFDPRR